MNKIINAILKVKGGKPYWEVYYSNKDIERRFVEQCITQKAKPKKHTN